MIIQFQIEYHTHWGQQLFVSGSSAKLGKWEDHKSAPMVYRGEGKWELELQLSKAQNFQYRYLIKHENGSVEREFGEPREIEVGSNSLVRDNWRSHHHVDNVFGTSPFTQAYFHRDGKSAKSARSKKGNLRLSLRANRISPDHHFCVIGNAKELGKLG